MYRSVKARFEEAKVFVVNHKTLVACTVTAVATAKLTHGATMQSVAQWAYDKGHEAGHLHVAIDEAYAFIHEKGLESEFVDFAHMPEA